MEQVNIEKVNKLIKQKGVSQYELAERCGVSQSTISKHLKTGNFGVNELLGIADALEVSIKDLFQKVYEYRVVYTTFVDHMYTDAKNGWLTKEQAETQYKELKKVGNVWNVKIVKRGEDNEQERLF